MYLTLTLSEHLRIGVAFSAGNMQINFKLTLVLPSPGAAIQRRSLEKVFWKYASNLQENTHGCSPVNLLHLFRTAFPKNTSEWLLPPVTIGMFHASLVSQKANLSSFWIKLYVRSYAIKKLFENYDKECVLYTAFTAYDILIDYANQGKY